MGRAGLGSTPCHQLPHPRGQDVPCCGWAPAWPQVCLLTPASPSAGKPALKHTGQFCLMLWAVQG